MQSTNIYIITSFCAVLKADVSCWYLAKERTLVPFLFITWWVISSDSSLLSLVWEKHTLISYLWEKCSHYFPSHHVSRIWKWEFVLQRGKVEGQTGPWTHTAWKWEIQPWEPLFINKWNIMYTFILLCPYKKFKCFSAIHFTHTYIHLFTRLWFSIAAKTDYWDHCHLLVKSRTTSLSVCCAKVWEGRRGLGLTHQFSRSLNGTASHFCRRGCCLALSSWKEGNSTSLSDEENGATVSVCEEE